MGKPLIGQINLEDELRMLEEKANASYGAYKDQVETKKRLEEENVAAKEEIKALIKQIEAEQGNMSQYTDRQAAATAEKTQLEAENSVINFEAEKFRCGHTMVFFRA